MIELDLSVFNKPKIIIYDSSGNKVKVIYPEKGTEYKVFNEINKKMMESKKKKKNS